MSDQLGPIVIENKAENSDSNLMPVVQMLDTKEINESVSNAKIELWNQMAQTKTVMEGIDEPLQAIVFHLNRAGLRTCWSCCGFDYGEKEIPRSHSFKLYIHFYRPTTDIGIRNFFNLANLTDLSLEKFGNDSNIWSLNFKNILWDEKTEWGGTEENPEMHDYEHKILAIRKLNHVVQQLETVFSQFPIEDTNDAYRKTYGLSYWKVKGWKSVMFKLENPNDDKNPNSWTIRVEDKKKETINENS